MTERLCLPSCYWDHLGSLYQLKKCSKVAEWPGLLVWDILFLSEWFSCVLPSSCMEGIPQGLVEISGQISANFLKCWQHFFFFWQWDLLGIHSNLKGLFSIFPFFCVQIAHQLQYMQERGFLNLEKLTALHVL